MSYAKLALLAILVALLLVATSATACVGDGATQPVWLPGDVAIRSSAACGSLAARDIVNPPISDANMKWARHWRTVALRNCKYENRLRRCLCLGPRALPRYTEPDYPGGPWREWGRKWRVIAQQSWKRCLALHHRITHPRGTSVARWLPLAKHVGWPVNTWSTLLRVMGRESGGRPWAQNGVFHGLLQIWTAHAPGWDLFNPHINLAIGLQLWRRLHWTPWASTAY